MCDAEGCVPLRPVYTSYIYIYIFLRHPGGRSLCGRSTAGVAGSNPAEAMDVRRLRLLCVVKVAAYATGRSPVKGSPTMCVRLIM